MNIKTIDALNNLNELFYQTVGNEFDRTRQQFWEGWDNLLPHIQNFSNDKQIKVLDLACGNSRFGRFLDEKLNNQKISYVGIEREDQLLDLAQKALEPTKLKYTLQKVDIVARLLDNTLEQDLDNDYDIIVVFGLLHHIPSENLRQKLISILSSKLQKGGLFIISSWQFAKLPRFSERFIDPKVIHIDQTDLEKNDHILDWHRGHVAYRYCHHADENELQQLIINTHNLKIIDSFYADGKTHQLNCYAIAERVT